MKLFLKRLALFSALSITILLISIVFTEGVIRKKGDFKLASENKYIVMGHSHPECAFNDSLINGFKNLSRSGESYFYTYFKTKNILEQNPSIDVIFLELTNNQIRKSMDNWIWEKSRMNSNYFRYSPYMSLSHKKFLAENNFSAFINSVSLSISINLGNILMGNFDRLDNIGGYNYLTESKVDSLYLKNIENVKTIEDYDFEISESNLVYLDHIIEYCRTKQKRVILIRSPMHNASRHYMNEEIYQEIIKERYPNLDYFDFSKFPLNNEEYRDINHLNYKGAHKFSKWFSTIINNGLLISDNPQEFINKSMNNQF